MSYEQKTKLTFHKLSEILGFRFKCNCAIGTTGTTICSCTTPCYCQRIQSGLLTGVSKLLKDNDASHMLLVFKELQANNAKSDSAQLTMLECASFIHRVNEKREQLSKYEY